MQYQTSFHYSSDEPIKKRIAKETEDKEDTLINERGISKSFKQLENSVSKFVEGRSLKVNFNEAIDEITPRDAQGNQNIFYFIYS